MDTRRTILVVDDDPDLQEVLSLILRSAGYRDEHAASAQEAESAIGASLPELCLLDWTLPDGTGLAFVRRLRASPRTEGLPVILVTGHDAESDRVAGLEAGADDYLVKPFSVRELLARMKAVIRRASPQHADEAVAVDGLVLDPAAHRVTAGGSDIDLGAIDFRILRLLMTHPGRVYGRAQLLDEVWGNGSCVEERTVDVHIRQLRKALHPSGHAERIATKRNVGYCFRRDVSGSGDSELRRRIAVTPSDSRTRMNINGNRKPQRLGA